MKILYTNFHEYNGGGHDTYIAVLCKNLTSTQNIFVAAPATSDLLKKVAAINTVKTFPFNFQFRITNFFSLCKKILELKRFLAKEQFDIIHVNGSKDHTLVILATAFLPKKPKIIFTKHNSLPIKLGAKIRYCCFTDHIIVVSENTKQAFLSIKTPITVIRNGIDINFFKPHDPTLILQLRKKYGLNPGDIVFGSVAGTAVYKGWPLLLEAIIKLSPALAEKIKVIIAGSMPSSEERENYINKLHLKDKVILTGLLADVREVIAVMDIGFVLSYAIETISFACREMMAMGKPVIVSDYSGLSENITESVDGYIIKNKDVDSIKNCIEEIMKHPQNLFVMGENARKKAIESFSDAKFVAATLVVYESEIL
jgi:L-malate glycosyltransferase